MPSDRGAPMRAALRCLLGPRPLPDPTPHPSQGSGPPPVTVPAVNVVVASRHGVSQRSGRITVRPLARLASLTCWPGAGLRSNIPLIATMSTWLPGLMRVSYMPGGDRDWPVACCPAELRLRLAHTCEGAHDMDVSGRPLVHGLVLGCARQAR